MKICLHSRSLPRRFAATFSSKPSLRPRSPGPPCSGASAAIDARGEEVPLLRLPLSRSSGATAPDRRTYRSGGRMSSVTGNGLPPSGLVHGPASTGATSGGGTEPVGPRTSGGAPRWGQPRGSARRVSAACPTCGSSDTKTLSQIRAQEDELPEPGAAPPGGFRAQATSLATSRASITVRDQARPTARRLSKLPHLESVTTCVALLGELPSRSA